jgi:hypothetical protein
MLVTVTDRGPRNRLNYNDERLKLLISGNLLLFVRTATVTKTPCQLEYFNNLGHSRGYTQRKGHIKTGQAEELGVLCWVPEALHRYSSLKMSILVFLLNMLISFRQDLATALYIISRNAGTIAENR